MRPGHMKEKGGRFSLESQTYQALYRKYRPKTFDDVVGQEHITETLKQEIAGGRVGHAYLFTGSRERENLLLQDYRQSGQLSASAKRQSVRRV